VRKLEHEKTLSGDLHPAPKEGNQLSDKPEAIIPVPEGREGLVPRDRVHELVVSWFHTSPHHAAGAGQPDQGVVLITRRRT
jgi:hypothetical protein